MMYFSRLRNWHDRLEADSQKSRVGYCGGTGKTVVPRDWNHRGSCLKAPPTCSRFIRRRCEHADRLAIVQWQLTAEKVTVQTEDDRMDWY